MSALDLDFIRSQFPAFTEPSLEGFAHFENAGGSYACRQTIEWLNRYYRQTKVQPYYAFAPSKLAGEQMDAARDGLAERRHGRTAFRPLVVPEHVRDRTGLAPAVAAG
jgi:selenocysteine lyase/cysteine desulfurase